MAENRLSVVVHGHFYQPPRENPWSGVVEAQPSAAPFHDWNERVEAECYRAVVAARIPGAGGRIASIVNLLNTISFNFGPTLLAWMEQHASDTYGAIVAADVESRARNGGHGNAIAQAYHHTILPLASRREKVTEVRWGIADFRRRFGREPGGMWLPETALDAETLDVLAQEGIQFTIVAPHQLQTVPRGGLPGRFRTASGRSIALFPYDGPLSHGVAFGPLSQDAEAWAKAILDSHRRTENPEDQGIVTHPEEGEARPSRPSLISIATDGETYGHHHRFGEMALAGVLGLLSRTDGVRVENFSSFLARTPPAEEVHLVEPSSWSCSHGVERWRSNCGCRMDVSVEPHQEWRGPLRKAMDWLAKELHSIYEAEGRALLGDPWAVLDRMGEIGPENAETIREILREVAPGLRTERDKRRGEELLALERNTLRLFTSCGWFFDDLAGIEPVQNLRYAARALELAGPRGQELETGFLNLLEEGLSSETPPRDGRTVFLDEAKPRAARPGHPPQAGRADQVPGDEQAGIAVATPETSRALLAAGIAEATSETSRALLAEVQNLDVAAPAESLTATIENIRELAERHAGQGNPIPFDVQTHFYRILKKASPDQAELLSVLREPLGFVLAP